MPHTITHRIVVGAPVTPTGGGQERMYVLNWPDLVGLRIRWGAKKRRPLSATWRGESLTGPVVQRLAAVKVWIGCDDDQVHVDGASWVPISEQEIVEAIERADR